MSVSAKNGWPIFQSNLPNGDHLCQSKINTQTAFACVLFFVIVKNYVSIGFGLLTVRVYAWMHGPIKRRERDRDWWSRDDDYFKYHETEWIRHQMLCNNIQILSAVLLNQSVQTMSTVCLWFKLAISCLTDDIDHTSCWPTDPSTCASAQCTFPQHIFSL